MSGATKKKGHRVAIALIIAIAVIAVVGYYYYTNHVDVVNVQLSISIAKGVPAVIPVRGVSLQGETSAESASCSISPDGATATCQVSLPNGGSGNANQVVLQVQLDFNSSGCAYPTPAVTSGSLTISQDFSEPDTFCNAPGISSYHFDLISGATGYQVPLGAQSAVASITFTNSTESP
ncbi:MAG TPA: hypothetical protein VLY21_02920 [Nitrososphaerales archaeon]|nr:hypothetical protein [Nitrososphaerales archaeon]